MKAVAGAAAESDLRSGSPKSVCLFCELVIRSQYCGVFYMESIEFIKKLCGGFEYENGM